MMRISYGSVIKYFMLIFVGLIWLIPLLCIIVSSFRPNEEIMLGWWNIKKLTLTLDNYKLVLFSPVAVPGLSVPKAIFNSIKLALIIIPLTDLIAISFAYALYYIRSKLLDNVFFMVLVLMAVPPILIINTAYILLSKMNLISHMGYIILEIGCLQPWGILFFRNYMMTIPREIIDAAKVDGASHFWIFFKIVLPMSLPALLSMSTVYFIWIWSDYLFPLCLFLKPEEYTLTQVVPFFKGVTGIRVNYATLSAATMLDIIVPIIILAVLSKYIVKGLVAR